MQALKKILFIGCLAALLLPSCRKDQPVNSSSSAKINFSVSTVYFDTVFTSVGSVTRRFKIYNPNNEKVILSRISLLHGSGSLFRMNVDGTPGKSISSIEIGPKDSLFVFVEVTINPSPGATPFIVSDSILFNWNGNTKAIGLVAWGQNAYYIMPDHFPANGPAYKIVAREGHDTTFNVDKPIVVYGFAVVDSVGILRIPAGGRIYFHPGAGLRVYRGGTLKVNENGTAADSVVFQGDRLDYDYREIPGQWDRIWINEGSVNNVINHAIIKNGFIGIQAEVLPSHYDGTIDQAAFNTPNKLTLNNTIIRNMTGAGILARAFNITGGNDVVANCGQFCAALTEGGTYKFTQCTFGDYYLYANRQTPAVLINNYLAQDNIVLESFDIQATFNNSILYGSLENEVGLDKSPFGSNAFAYTFDHCLLRIDPATNVSTSNFIGVKTNSQNAVFNDPVHGDFTLAEFSDALQAGSPTVIGTYTTDIKGKPRTLGNPDLGAYQKK